MGADTGKGRENKAVKQMQFTWEIRIALLNPSHSYCIYHACNWAQVIISQLWMTEEITDFFIIQTRQRNVGALIFI